MRVTCVMPWLALTLLSSAIVSHAAFTTVPAAPIQYMPLLLRDLTTTLTQVKLTIGPDCSVIVAGGGPYSISQGSVLFTVTAQDTTVYLCDTATNTMQRSVNFSPVTFSPRFAFRNVATTITFNSITPSSTPIRFRSFPDCVNTNAPPIDGALDAQRSFSVTLNTNQFACVTLTSEATGAPVTLNAGLVTVTDPIGFSPNEAIYSTLVVFSMSGAAPSGAAIRLSVAADCSDSTATYTAGGPNGLTVSTTMLAPRGTYQFCVQITSGVYASAGVLNVLRFGASPTTAFQGRPTVFTLTLDSPLTTSAIIAASQSCTGTVQGPLFASLTTGKLTPVTLTVLGTYFLCVQPINNNNQFVLATQIQVVPPYDVTFTHNPVVRGIATTLTVLPNPQTIVRFSLIDDCQSSFLDVQTQATTATVVFPTSGPTTTMAILQVCVVTSDGSAVYPITTVNLRDFNMSYQSLVKGFASVFTLDAQVPQPTCQFSLASTSSCTDNAVPGSPYTVTSPPGTTAITATANNTFYVCYHSTATIKTMIRPVTVLPAPLVSPNASLTLQPVTVIVQNVPVSTPVTVGTSCTGGIVANAVSSGVLSFTFQATFPATGTYLICAQYAGFQTANIPREIGRIAVADLTSVPRYHVAGRPTKLMFSVPGGFADPTSINTHFYLALTTICGVPLGVPTYTILAGVAAFTPPNAGTYLVCAFGAGSTVSIAGYIPAGSLTVLAPIDVTLREPYGTLQRVPFTFNMSQPFAPAAFSIFALTPTTSTQDTAACLSDTVSAASDFFLGSGISPPVSLPLLQKYLICVRSPDLASLLPATIVTVTQATLLTTTFIQTLRPPLIAASPTLPASVFEFDLFMNAQCTGEPTGQVSTDADVTVPARRYFVCLRAKGSSASNPPWRSAAVNSVAVVDPFSASIDPNVNNVRGNVPFNVTVRSDAASNNTLAAVYLLSGRNQYCNKSRDDSVWQQQQAQAQQLQQQGLPTDIPVGQTVPPGAVIGQFIGIDFTTVTVTVPARQNVTLCIASVDQTASSTSMSITPLPYSTPAEIVKGTNSQLVSGGAKRGVLLLASDARCQFVVWGPGPILPVIPSTTTPPPTLDGSVTLSTTPVPLTATFVASDILVSPTTASLTKLYWCEAGDISSTFVAKDIVGLLTPFVVTFEPQGVPATPPNVSWTPPPATTVLPGIPLTLNVPASAGDGPFISRFAACNDSVNTTFGIFPTIDGPSDFFVCVRSAQGTVYTTPKPTITVARFFISPNFTTTTTEASLSLLPSVIRYSNANFVGSRVSTDSRCTKFETDFISLRSPTRYVFGNPGVKYVCVQPSEAIGYLPVASFTVFAPPAVQPLTRALVGPTFAVTVRVPLDLFGLGSNSDAGSNASVLLANRSFFLVPASPTGKENATFLPPASVSFFACSPSRAVKGSLTNAVLLPNGTTAPWTATPPAMAVGPFYRVALNTLSVAAASSYHLCAPTPEGFVIVAPSLTFQKPVPIPSNIVADAVTKFTVFPNVSATLILSNSTECADLGWLPPFVTDAVGFVELDLRFARGALLDKITGDFKSGTYYLCLLDDQAPFVNTPVAAARRWSAQQSSPTAPNAVGAAKQLYTVIATLQIFAPQRYSISHGIFTPQTFTEVALLEDLTFDYLRGFSSTPTCEASTIFNGSGRAVIYPQYPSSSTAAVGVPPTPSRTTLIYNPLSETAKYYLCAQGPVNGSMLLVSPISFQRSVVEFPSAASACTMQTIGFVRQNDPLTVSQWTTVAVYDGACCTSTVGLDPSKIVATATRESVSTSLLTLQISEAAMDQFSPRTAFRMCVVNTPLNTCIDVGNISLSRAACQNTLIPAPGNSSGNRGGETLAPGSVLGGAPKLWANGTTFLPLLLLCVAFAILLILAVLLAMYIKRRTASVVPLDAAEGGELSKPGDDAFSATLDDFDQTFASNRAVGPRVDALHGMLSIPIDMTLDVCTEAPLPLQRAEREESLERSDIVRSEEFVFSRLLAGFLDARRELEAAIAAADRARLTHAALEVLEAEYREFALRESSFRDALAIDEEQIRLAMAEAERRGWRECLDAQAVALQRTISREEGWKSRKRRLMASGSRMLEHVEHAVTLSRDPNATTGTMPSAHHGGEGDHPASRPALDRQHGGGDKASDEAASRAYHSIAETALRQSREQLFATAEQESHHQHYPQPHFHRDSVMTPSVTLSFTDDTSAVSSSRASTGRSGAAHRATRRSGKHPPASADHLGDVHYAPPAAITPQPQYSIPRLTLAGDAGTH